MKALYIIALCFHLLEEKRLETKYETNPFQIQTVTEIIK
jgi:hypothetical protein